MAKREWTLSFPCGHEGCQERSRWSYQTKRDLVESFEQKHYSGGRWRCIRHTKPNEVLSPENPETRAELVVEQKPYGRYFGNFGFVSGPGFKVFASDLPEGAKVIVTATLVLPASPEKEG